MLHFHFENIGELTDIVMIKSKTETMEFIVPRTRFEVFENLHPQM